jgi:poly-gamma-glutamate synthesis protein (capsule biosynthesis protein)
VALAGVLAVVTGAPAAAVTAVPRARDGFSSSIRPIDAALAARMQYSWRPGCPVPLRQLRYVTVTYVGFDGQAHTGELVVRQVFAGPVVRAFHRLYDQRFAIRRMRLVDDYRGSDAASMRANNTSAFNCRPVTGGSGWSEHSYGRAIDVNPVQNPYVQGRTVDPPRGSGFLDRSRLRKGMLTVAARKAFADIGWAWGGRWHGLKDYMHFSSTNR